MDTYIIDSSAIIQMLKPKVEEYISTIVIPYVLTKASKYKRVDVVFDVYLKRNIKD